jgi:hypothetical protein
VVACIWVMTLVRPPLRALVSVGEPLLKNAKRSTSPTADRAEIFLRFPVVSATKVNQDHYCGVKLPPCLAAKYWHHLR